MKRQIDEHLAAIKVLAEDIPLIERIADRIIACFAEGGRVYIFGNGGSAADAQHIAAELLGRFKIDRKSLPAVALTTDTSTLTAVGNDLGYESVFSRQVEALATEKDIVWALSVSGTSPNVIAGLKAARDRGATTLGFTGRSGQTMADLCDLCLMAAHSDSDRVQEVHILAYHLICESVEETMATS